MKVNTEREKIAGKTKKSSGPKGKTVQNSKEITSETLQKRIEEKAYELYARRGYTHGNDILDWTLAQDLVELENKAAVFRKLRKNVKTEQLSEGIEKRAYELFEYRGYTNGSDLFDWSLAEEITFLKNGLR